MQFFIGVKALIQNEGKILLIKRSKIYEDTNIDGTWDIPGGRIKFGEEPGEALAREVEEETGLKIDRILSILDACIVFKDSEKQIVRITYLCSVKNTAITLSDEHTEYKWVSPIEAEVSDKLIKNAISRL